MCREAIGTTVKVARDGAGFRRHYGHAVLSHARTLRHDVADHFEWLGAGVDDAELVVTELFTNAVRHGSGPVTVLAFPFADGVRLRVCDGSRDFGGRGPDSRGLLLIDKLAARWGVERSPHGKAVWADICARR
jgi:anti-sigma regulatory factor (Ser/Thr protein kinase)